MTRVLCYGDSNTWGDVPGIHNRYNENERWTKLLQKELGKNYEVIEAGMRGRNLFANEIKFPNGTVVNGDIFKQCVLTHDPLDYLIIMLGTNDMRKQFNVTPKICAKGLEDNYIKVVKKELAKDLLKVPQIIVVSPSLIKNITDYESFEGAGEKSKSFNREYKKVATKNNCIFIDNSILEAGCDGVHLTKESHKKLAEALAKVIK